MKAVAVVTGASGYLGQALCKELIKRKWVVRRCSRTDRPTTDNTHWIRDDTDNQITDDQLFQGVDTVFHLAGLAHQHHSITSQTYTQANVEYTRSVATRATQAGIRHFVFISSVAAVADQSTDTPLTPQSEPAPQTRYGKSKLAAEQVVRQLIDPRSTTWTIIRPPLIYGENPKGNLRPLLRLSRSPMPLPFGAIDNKRSMVSLKNLVDLLAHCATPAFSAPNNILMPADICLSTPALVSAIRSANGAPSRMFDMPDIVYNWLTKLPGIGRRAQVLRSSLWIDDPFLRNATGWQAPFCAQEQINAMARS